MPEEPSLRRGVALVIGVGQYAHPGIGRLAHAAADADALADLLADPDVCAFPPADVVRLTDAAAGRDAVVEHLSGWLPARSRGAELALIYFAGHGLARPSGDRHEGYLLPHDADPAAPAVRGVAMADVLKWVGELQADAVVVCLDCCHAGLAITLRDATRDVTVRPEPARGPGARGRFLMVACEERQKSAEVAALGHGLFTSHLLKGIAGEGDRDGDGKVGLAELFEYVATAVAADTRRMGVEQRPWTEVVAAGGEYIARPRGRREPSPDGIGRERGPAEALAEIKRRMAGADPPALERLLRQAGRLADPLAVSLVMPYLAHANAAVAEAAKRAVQAIGIEKAFAAVEELARRGDSDLGPVLDGLGTYGARPDLVRLLDRVADFATGDVLTRAVNLLERKRLGLELEAMRQLFRENRVPYELRRPLGKGQLTAAYEADDPDGQVRVVVRVLLDDHARDRDVRNRFFAACQRALRLNSGHLVKTFHVRALRDDGAFYAVREYLDTPTLQEVLAGRPPDVPGRRFAPPQAAEVVRQLLSGVRDVHAAGGCHGGVRPSNVFVLPDLRVVLGDLAPVLPTVGPGKDRRRVYNYRYTPPEVFRGDDDVGPPADVYALGCVAYELFCGVPPVVSDRYHDQYTGHTERPLTPARAHAPGLPAEAEAFLARLLARDPAARPTAAAALDELAAVQAALAGEAAPRPKPPKPPVAPPGGSLWHHTADGVQVGPVSFDELKRAAAAGWLRPTDLVWEVGTPEWVLASAVPGLFPPPEPTIPPEPAAPVAPIRAQSLADYRPAHTRMSVGGDRPLTFAPPGRSPTDTRPVHPGVGYPSWSGGDHVREQDTPPGVPGYEILAQLGRGGMGAVYKARQVALNRIVALKMMLAWRGRADEAARFHLEAEAMAAIRHTNVTAVFDLGSSAGVPYIVMEYLPGGTLADRLRASEGMAPPDMVNVLLGVARGLAAAHARGIVHRDAKPANVLFDEHGTPKLTDFGLARIGATDLTATGAVMGTPAYMSPEQASGRTKAVGPATDVWSFGAMMYECLSGHRPFDGDHVAAVLHKVIEAEPAPLPRGAADRDLAIICSKCLQKDPSNRYPSAVELADDLERYSRREPILARPPSLWQRVHQWFRRRS